MSLQADLADEIAKVIREFIRDNSDVEIQTIEYAVQDAMSDVQVAFWAMPR